MYLSGVTRLMKEHGARVTNFDGDRAMALFHGDMKNTRAATCALKINYLVKNIIKPKVTEHFQSISQTGFEVTHCVGIDTGSVMAVRAGRRGTNDLVWIGRPPNLAAKLSEIRDSFKTYVSSDVFGALNESAKIGGNPPQSMWEQATWQFLGQPITLHRSIWTWAP